MLNCKTSTISHMNLVISCIYVSNNEIIWIRCVVVGCTKVRIPTIICHNIRSSHHGNHLGIHLWIYILLKLNWNEGWIKHVVAFFSYMPNFTTQLALWLPLLPTTSSISLILSARSRIENLRSVITLSSKIALKTTLSSIKLFMRMLIIRNLRHIHLIC